MRTHDHHTHHAHHGHHHGPDACCSGHDASVTRPPAPALSKKPVTGMQVQTMLRIMQMDCPTEEALLRQKLGSLAGVAGLEFNLMRRVLTVTHEPQALEPILTAVRSLGYRPEVADAEHAKPLPPAAMTWWPLALAGAAAAASEAVHGLGGPDAVVATLALVAVLSCGIGTYKKGWIAIRHGNVNINALMSIAVTGALLLGQWPEAAMVMVLFTVAERIEAQSLDRARQAIRGLLQLSPETATVLQGDGSWRELAASSVLLQARVRVKPGERIALDGTVVTGSASVNQAPITGESLPVDKRPGDGVFAGTINTSGSFEYTVTARADDSLLARIIHAVEEAQGAKAPTQRFVDQFARIYTPIVLVIALAVAVLPPWWLGGDWAGWAYKALVMLVIACPCALVISTPVTIVSGLAAAARQGILIKGGVYLEEGRKLRWLALDKTGTLTQGKPSQTDFFALDGWPAADVRSLAASLAARSDHPLSVALAQAAQKDGVTLQAVDQFEALAGRGIRGVINGKTYCLGSHRHIHEQGRCSEALELQLADLEKQGKTVMLLTDERCALGLFAVADTVREGSRQAIDALRALGINTVMLTGDNKHVAGSVARQVGLDDARAGLLPEDKRRLVQDLMAAGGAVGMVGDGINDAPALARADIGFAMGAAGSGTALETADVALMDDDLRKLPRFVRLSRETHARLVQNLVLALGIKAVFLVLTLAGLGTMWMAVSADVGASLLVVGNGLRLLQK